jgi:hypothetical protein
MVFIGNQPTAVPLTSSQLADGLITTDKLAASAVTSAKILDSTIVNADIASTTINLTQKVTDTLPATNGGTGVASYTAGNILYASNATTLATLAPGTSGFALTLNGTTPTWAAVGASAGQVIQVVSATDSTQRSTTSTSFVTASNTLSVSITPSSASNKIFIIVGTVGRTQLQAFFTVFRGATDLGAASSKGLSTIQGEDGVASVTAGIGISFLDSPATTSAITYELRFRAVTASTAYLNYDNPKGSITLMEVKG